MQLFVIVNFTFSISNFIHSRDNPTKCENIWENIVCVPFNV